MEQIGNGEEYKHVCRLCGKKYPTGKSLGGHMRSHVIHNMKSNQAPSFVNNGGHRLQSVRSKRVLTDSALADEEGRYGLRENPKKTWRAVDPKVKASHDRICKRCGKGFQSLKALCGHMSSHSSKSRNFSRLSQEVEEDDDVSNSRVSEEHLLESHSDNVVECSSENSEIEIGQEEVALCLMMLSRDSTQKVGSNSSESSDNSSAIDAAKRKNLNFSCSISMNSNVNGSVEMENSDSGYFEKGAKELESDDSFDGYSRNRRIKKPRAEFDDSEFGIGSKKSDCKLISAVKNVSGNRGHCCPFCSKVFRSGQALGGHKRSHLVGISPRERASLIRSVEDHHHPMPDLNLPAPPEEDGKW